MRVAAVLKRTGSIGKAQKKKSMSTTGCGWILPAAKWCWMAKP